MTETVHDVTDLQKPVSRRRKMLTLGAIGIAAFGVLLLINDKVGGKQKKDVTTDETD